MHPMAAREYISLQQQSGYPLSFFCPLTHHPYHCPISPLLSLRVFITNTTVRHLTTPVTVKMHASTLLAILVSSLLSSATALPVDVSARHDLGSVVGSTLGSITSNSGNGNGNSAGDGAGAGADSGAGTGNGNVRLSNLLSHLFSLHC